MNNKFEKEFGPSSWAINNSTTIYVLMSIILLLGISAYFNMPREDYPEIKENLVFVSSIYPGNTAEDLEKLITEPLEDKLKSINNIDKITSSSQENFSIIVIRFNDDIGYTEAKLKVKDEIEAATASEDWPMFNNVKVDPNVFNMTFTEERPILNINISGDYTTGKLKKYSEVLQKEIENLPEIKKVDIRGALDKEVEIAVDIYKMMAAKVSFYDIISSVQNGNISISAGNLKANGKRKTIRILGEINSPKDLENFVVKSTNDSPGMEQPLYYWLPSIAPSSFEYISSNIYPNWNGSLLAGALVFKHIERIGLKNNKVVSRSKIAEGLGRPRDIKQGPDGYIYVSIENKGIYKIIPKE